MKNISKTFVYALIIFILVSGLYALLQGQFKERKEISLSELVAGINAGKVERITVEENVLTIKMKDSGDEFISRKESEAGLSETLKNYGVDQEKLKGVTLEVKSLGGFSYWLGVIIPFLAPLILIGFFIWWTARQVQRGSVQAFSFGQSRARLVNPENSRKRIMFKDVAGAKEAKEELREIVDFLKNPKKFFDIGARIPHGVLLMGAPGTGKCVTGDTVLVTNKGNIPIEDVPKYFTVRDNSTVEGLDIVAVDPNTLDFRKVGASHWYNLGAQKTIRLNTDVGATIEGTHEHPIVAVDPISGNFLFKRLDEIREGEWVVIGYNTNVFGRHTKIPSPDAAYLLGVLTGDGCLTIKNRIVISTADNEILGRMQRIAEETLGATFSKSASRPYDYEMINGAAKAKLLEWGLEETYARGKRVPEWVRIAPREFVVSYLRGLFDTDGGVERNGGVCLSSASPALIREVSAMLLNLGIIHRSYERKKLYNNQLQYYVMIYGDFIERFQSEIGFTVVRKAKALEKICERQRNTNINRIPHQGEAIRKVWQEAVAATSRRLDRAFCGESLYKNTKRYIDGTRLPSLRGISYFISGVSELAPSVRSMPELAYLERLSSGQYFFTKVSEVSHSTGVVYDLTVPHYHNFIANGLINHNTLLARAVSGEANVPFFHISGSEFVEMFVGVGASVTGNTPVLVRHAGQVKLAPIQEVIDAYYPDGGEGLRVAGGLETLGVKKRETNFQGFRGDGEKFFFGGSQWVGVKHVYRHKAEEIYQIRYRGGVIQTTGDHSIFVREKNYVRSKRADQLKPGDILVNLPFKVRSTFIPGAGTTHHIRSHAFGESQIPVLSVWEEEGNKARWQREYAFAFAEEKTQHEIGSVIGVSQATVGHWLSGIHQPRMLAAPSIEHGLPEKVVVTSELMRLLGYYTAEGRTTRYAVEFIFGSHEQELHEDCINLMRSIFSLEPRVTMTPDSTTRITYSSVALARFFERYCGNGSHYKHVPEFIWNLPFDFVKEYVSGYSQGDGYITGDGKLVISSVSSQIIRELAWILGIHGVQAGVGKSVSPSGRRIKADSKPLPETVSWRLTIGRTSNLWDRQKPSRHPNQFKKPEVLEITKHSYDGYVYDFCGCDNEAFFGGEKPTLLHNSRVRDLFKIAKKSAPAIIFIDEIDAVGRHRGTGLGGGHDEREQTLNQILVEMDGFETNESCIVIAASVTGDTPVLVKQGGEHELRPIAEVIDRYYAPGEEGIEKLSTDLKVLGLEPKLSSYTDKKRTYFGASAFKSVRSVFRHWVDEIYEIKFLGGVVRTTGNHSVFIRTPQGIVAKRVDQIRPGEILVDIPHIANRTQKTRREVRAHRFPQTFERLLPVYESYPQAEGKYAFAIANRSLISQAKIAGQIGVSQTTISKWHRTSRLPREMSHAYFLHSLPVAVPATPELMRLLGYYTAEGYARKEVDFCFNRDEIAYIEDVKDLMYRVFGLPLHAERETTVNAVNIVYSSRPMADFFIRHCGKGARGKHVPAILFEAPREHFVEFLRGLFRGDGYKDKHGRLEITSVSKQLILELNWLARMHGFKSYVNGFTARAGRVIGNGKPLPETVAYRLGFGKTQNPFEYVPGKKSIKRPKIIAITKKPYSGYVYDFCGCENEAFFGGETPILLHNTNRPDVLDPALLRPGRFDRRVVLDLPDINDREDILKIHAANKVMDKNVSIRTIAERTPGFSGADLANLVNEAAILAARGGRKSIAQNDLVSAIEKVMLGPERKSHILTPKEKEIVAYHEAGHALVAASLKNTDPVHKISIVARGRAGGVTWKLPSEDRHLFSRSYFLDEIAVSMGGFAAEKIAFNEITTGPHNDLERATDLARDLVTRYGMSDKLGPTVFGDRREMVFLGKEIGSEKNYSEQIAELIDSEVRRIIDGGLKKAREIVASRRAKLDEIAKRLMEKETIERDEFEALMQAA